MNGTLTVFSPAKVNLHLAIGAKRADGYHDACSVMQALTLHDTVTVRHEQGERGERLHVDVSCATHGGVAALDITPEDNIAYKALFALLTPFGERLAGHRFSVHIDKSIPHAAGLGGGSSNAAAVLLAACRMLDLDPLSEEVLAVAAGIGADVPFFLHGGCVQMGGRGDVFERTLEPMKGSVVLVRPDAGVSTAAAYRAFDESPQPISASDAARLESAQAACDVAFFNNLAAASEAVLPELAEVRAWLSAQPGVARDEATDEPRVLLSGSGSATFCVCDSMNDAYAIVSAAKQRGWWARSCSFSPAGARIVEGRMPGMARTNVGAVHKSW
ncbi:MAG: 4-(cytidine 5'-diphospho)-2-C-methyl-D-erythritol kinase [Slackia sp.]|nr:4-(cytidine 5'-diphospho)-2-C-methyl-D-erythritol kinase [Slackia sp.]